MKNAILPLLAAVTFAFASCNDLKKPQEKDQPQEATADTAVVYRDGRSAGAVADNAFNLTRERLADVKLPEIKTSGITVQSDSSYQVYSVDESILFDTDKATIKPSAAAAIQEISGSINQRFAGHDVRVMGFADSRGDAAYNYDLAKQRAEAVKAYLAETGKMPADKLSTESFGEQQPAATNATAEGRKENRRVEIAVRVK
jgi:outer membrane protein OmpA-like peptidoglycan-associated protein